MDLILRNGHIDEREEQTTVEIGIQAGRIVAIESHPSHLAADGRELDLQGRLVTPGFIETQSDRRPFSSPRLPRP